MQICKLSISDRIALYTGYYVLLAVIAECFIFETFLYFKRGYCRSSPDTSSFYTQFNSAHSVRIDEVIH